MASRFPNYTIGFNNSGTKMFKSKPSKKLTDLPWTILTRQEIQFADVTVINNIAQFDMLLHAKLKYFEKWYMNATDMNRWSFCTHSTVFWFINHQKYWLQKGSN